MNAKLSASLVLCIAAGFAFIVSSLLAATDEKLDPETKARVERYEKGPKTIDVSKYPAAIQAKYDIFRAKCTLCHELSRPINSDYVLPDEWSRYVKRMMHKPGSNITQASGKQIYEFLAYDSSVRKKAAFEAKLAQLPAAEKAEAQARIDELHKLYDGK